MKGHDLDIPGEIKFLLDVDGFQKIVFLHTAQVLGIFDALSKRRARAKTIAQQNALHEEFTASLLHALAGLGYLQQQRGIYSLSHFSSVYLVSTSKEYIGDYISLFTDTWKDWMALPYVARSGKPVPGMKLRGQQGKAVLRYYIAANEVVKQAVAQLADRLDLRNVRQVICGEVGLTFLQALLARKPEIAYTLAALKEHKRYYPGLLRRFPLPKSPQRFVYSAHGQALKDSWGGKGAYDLVFLYRKLAFYRYGDQFIKKSFRALSLGGMVVVCEPTTDSLLHFMRWILDAIQIMDYMIGGTRAPRLMSSKEIETRLRKAGFRKTKTVSTMFGVFQFVVGIK